MKLDIHWPQAAVAMTAIVSFVALYLLAPDSRDVLEKAVLGAWALLSTFLRPMLRRSEVES